MPEAKPEAKPLPVPETIFWNTPSTAGLATPRSGSGRIPRPKRGCPLTRIPRATSPRAVSPKISAGRGDPMTHDELGEKIAEEIYYAFAWNGTYSNAKLLADLILALIEPSPLADGPTPFDDHEVVATKLSQMGWRASNDAQWDHLRDWCAEMRSRWLAALAVPVPAPTALVCTCRGPVGEAPPDPDCPYHSGDNEWAISEGLKSYMPPSAPLTPEYVCKGCWKTWNKTEHTAALLTCDIEQEGAGGWYHWIGEQSSPDGGWCGPVVVQPSEGGSR